MIKKEFIRFLGPQPLQKPTRELGRWVGWVSRWAIPETFIIVELVEFDNRGSKYWYRYSIKFPNFSLFVRLVIQVLDSQSN